MSIDIDFMRRCFQLAELGRHTCRPNPAVGCVIAHGSRVAGEGWHAVAGEAHAEVVALRQAGDAARGATAYVSLEPCAHQGRTGPCAEALMRAGVAEVVYGMQDPNPLVAGKGLALLQAAGIRVRGPLLQAEAEQVNPGFNKRMRLGLPWLRCKVGMSLDGRTAMANGESQWITGPESRADVQKWRARSCAILTGSGTVRADDPQLNVRLPGFRGPQPLRVVAGRAEQIPATARLCVDGGPVLLATPVDFPAANGRVDLEALLRHLAGTRHCNDVLVEAGPTLTGALLQAGLVDELLLYMAPSLLGHEARPLALLPGLHSLAQRIELQLADVAMLGKDCRIRALPTLRG